MRAPIKEIRGSLVIGVGDVITSADDLVDFTIDGEVKTVGGSVLRKITGTYLGTRNLAGTVVEAKAGVRIASGDYEDMSLGKFLITKIETVKDRDTVKFTGFDLMIYSILPYKGVIISEYPTTVGALYQAIASTSLLETETADIPFKDLAIDVDLYSNISGTTYRDVLEDIAIIGGSVAMIGEGDQLRLRNIKTPTNALETLSYAELKELTLKDKYGKVNSLVLSRQPQEDNVVLQNEASVAADGLTEIKIENNEIIDKRREEVAEDIFPYFDGTEYYPFIAKTVGFGYYEIGDRLNIIDAEGTTRNVRVMGMKLTIDGGITETLYSSEPSKTSTNYSTAGGLNNRIKNTEIVVDKQQQLIQSVVEQIDTLDGVVNENYTEIMQTIDNITQTVQKSGGMNLLKNSAFFQYDNAGIPTIWTTTGAGTVNIQASSEAIANGSLSGNIITLKGTKVAQTIPALIDLVSTPEDKKIYYSFRVMVKKGIIGTATVKVSNAIESYEVVIPNGTPANYQEVKFDALLPQANNYKVELSGSSDSDATFTDAMFNIGKYSTPWQQANGEILNTNVTINENGIIVKSSIYAGDYTAITPLEFSGYAKIGSSIIKAFTLNKDQTEVAKLLASQEISMPPIKIVPITTGSVTGWAYVKRSA